MAGIWIRHIVLFLVGLFFVAVASSLNDEARTYKDGPKATDAAAVTEATLEYDYLELSGFTDGFHYVYYFQPENSTDENDVDLEEEIVMYYALLDEKQYDRSMNGEQSKPAVLVRQILPEDTDRSCAETDEGCLSPGKLTLTGKLMPTLPNEKDDETFTKVIDEGLYATNNKTLYFDADWEPATSGVAGFARTFSWLWVGLTAVSLPWSLSRRRKKIEMTRQPAQQQPQAITEEDQNNSPQM
jgi:hypothetical protein